MKIKSILSLLVLTLVLFVSCSSDDDSATEFSLVGNWQLQSKLNNGTMVQLEPCEGEAVFSFTEGGSFTLKTKALNQQSNVCTAEAPRTGTYTTSGNSITLNITMMTQNASYELTATTLSITYVDTDDNSTEVLNFIRVQ